MNIHQILVIVGIVLIQVSGANAQFGNLGNLIDKKLNKQKAATNQPPIAQSETKSETADVISKNDSRTISNPNKTSVSGGKTSNLNLPPIFEAARQCDEARFAELLKKDMSSINKTVGQVSGSRFNYGNEKRDADGNIIPDEGKKFEKHTLLALAAENGCTNIIQQLLDLEVDVEPRNITVLMPLSLAAGNGHLEAVKMLLKAKAKPDDGMRAACENGRAEVVKVLLENGASGEGLLETAVAKGHLEIVQVLLKQKIYQSKWDGSQRNAHPSKWDGYIQRKVFRTAIAKGNLDIVKAFVAEGEDVSDDRDNDDRQRNDQTLVQIAIGANQAEIVAYLKEAKKAQVAAISEKEVEKAKNEAGNLAAKEKEKAAENEVFQKKVLAFLDHPTDLFGMATSRYRKFNGKVYDCAEPIEFLNRLYAFLPIEGQYNDKPESLKEIKGRIEAESKWLHENPWYKIQSDCSVVPVLVKQVTRDGLIVRLNSQQDEEILVLLKNHPKQKTAVDGQAIIEESGQLFVIKTSPYQYTGVLGAIQTIPSYDLGVVMPKPSGSVAKLPLPEAGR